MIGTDMWSQLSLPALSSALPFDIIHVLASCVW